MKSSENEAIQQTALANWQPASGLQLHLLITKDEEACYSAVAINLPGVGSCGDTEEETIANVKEAALGVIAEYRAMKVAIPWKESHAEKIPEGAKEKWIALDA